MKRLNIWICMLFFCSPSFGQDLYDIDHVTVIELEFSVSNWDAILDNYYANDLDERLIASCTINGLSFDSVGVKYKGNSTYSANNLKNPINISLDHIIQQDYQGFETIKLSNGKNDPSFVREVLSYEMLRKYMVAPLSNYARVYINGSYHGLFSNSESINGDFGERYLFANGNNTRFKCNPVTNFGNTGSSLTYLGTDSTSYYDSYELKSDFGWLDMINLTNTIANSPPSIESILDIDKVIWMFAYNNVTVNLDSYTGLLRQNYYLIKDNNGIINSIIWDLNEGLGGFEAVFSGGAPNTNDMISMDPLIRENENNWPLLNLIYANDTYKRMYIAHCRTILEENFTNGWYLARADSLQSVIDSSVVNDPNSMYSYSDFQNNVYTSTSGGPGAVGIEELMAGRLQFLQANQYYTYAPPTLSNINTSPSNPTGNSSISISATIQNGNYAFVSYRSSSADEFQKAEMFDDGLHDDGAAGDGVYGADIAMGATEVQYYLYAENNDAGIFSPERAAHAYYNISLVGDLVINEIQASNANTISDDSGEYDDWVELYNNSASDISLSGYFLSDDSGDLSKWAFPSVTISANSYLIIWTDNDTSQTGNHANFKLSAAGEALLLVNPGLTIIDELVFGAQITDRSYGRYPNGTGGFAELYPTYNGENSLTIGLSPNTMISNMIVFPNPATETVSILFETGGIPGKVYVYNKLGAMVLQGEGKPSTPLNISELPIGMYFVKTSDGEVCKLIIL